MNYAVNNVHTAALAGTLYLGAAIFICCCVNLGALESKNRSTSDYIEQVIHYLTKVFCVCLVVWIVTR